MLQTVKLEPNAAPMKARNGTDNGSDPALALFAGMMVQANATPRTPPPADISTKEAAGGSRSVERLEAPEPERPQEPAEAQKASVEPGQAKVAERMETPESDPAETPEEDSATLKSAAQPAAGPPANSLPALTVAAPQVTQATTGTPTVDLPSTDASTSTMAPAGPTAVQQANLAAKPQVTDATTTKPMPALPKELSTSVEVSTENLNTNPVAAMKELLHLPKVEIQTPKLNTASALGNQPGTVPISPETPSGETQSNGDSPELGPEAAPSLQAAAKPQGGVIEPVFIPHAAPVESAGPQAATPMMSAPESVGVLPLHGSQPVQTLLPAEAASPVRPSPIVSQVEGSIRWILHSKSQGAELQLHPESLGRVVIQLKVDGQEVHAKLWVSETSSLTLLQDHKVFLENSLKEQGLVLSSFDLHSGARGNGAHTASQEQAHGSPRHLPHLEIKQEVPTEIQWDPAEPYRIEVFA